MGRRIYLTKRPASTEPPTTTEGSQPPLNRSKRRTSVASSSSTSTISSTSPSSAWHGSAVIAFDGPEQRKPIDLPLRKRSAEPRSMNRRMTTRYRRFDDLGIARGDHRVGFAYELQCVVEDIATKTDAKRLEQSRRLRCQSSPGHPHADPIAAPKSSLTLTTPTARIAGSDCSERQHAMTPPSSVESERECKRTIATPST